MVQTCRVISQLPGEKLNQLELEGKIKNRVRLQPREKVKAPFPTNWQQIGALQCRLWTPEARMPKVVQDGYLLYTNQDIHLQGSTMVPTGVDLKLPPDVIGLLVPCNPNSNYVVNMLHISSEQRISVHVIAPFPEILHPGDLIAKLVLIPAIVPAPEFVTAGQKVQNKPSPFLKNLSPDQDQILEELLKQYKDIFAEDLIQLGQATTALHRIDTAPDGVAYSKRYRQSWENEDFIDAEVGRMLKANIVKPLNIDIDEESNATPFSAPVVIVGKKDGSKRFCIDYRKLNDITTTNPYPLPIINEIFSNIAKRGPVPKFFTALDLASGYWQVRMHPDHVHKTTFTCHLGLYSFLRMPFGLKNAPASFQSMMDMIFRDQIDRHMAVFIDDINIYSQTYEEHLEHLKKTFDKCRKYGLKIKRKKCHFACEKLDFLGHVVSKDGLLVDPRKIEVIQDFGTPTNSKQIREFLGMTGYYSQFIDHYQEKAAHLQLLLRKRARFAWTVVQATAFQQLKDALVSAAVLAYPNMKYPFKLMTDASDLALGAVLMQWNPEEEREYVVSYASKALSPAEKNYDATDKEGLAVVWAIRKYRRYLQGRHFDLYTDHKALLSIIHKLEPRGKRRARRVSELQEYHFTIWHLEGKKNVVADALSRNPTFGVTDQ